MKLRPTIKEMQEAIEEHNTCEKCGQHFANHNDDGSCVDDEYEAENYQFDQEGE
jgi:hypothetical protein